MIKHNANRNNNFTELSDKILNTFSGLRNIINNKILNKMTRKGDIVYFTEHLGNIGNKKRDEDAIFSTSLHLNTLLNMWTYNVYKDNGEIIIKYDPETSDEIKTVIDKLVTYLVNNADNKHQNNHFFSNGYHTLPHYMPANYYKNMSDGSDFVHFREEGCEEDEIFTFGIKGYVPREKYNELLKETYFGKKVPIEYSSFNVRNAIFYCCPAYTQSLVLLALAKYKHIEN